MSNEPKNRDDGEQFSPLPLSTAKEAASQLVQLTKELMNTTKGLVKYTQSETHKPVAAGGLQTDPKKLNKQQEKAEKATKILEQLQEIAEETIEETIRQQLPKKTDKPATAA